MSMLAARCKAVRRIQASNPEKSEADILSKLVAYTSDQVSTNIYNLTYFLFNVQAKRTYATLTDFIFIISTSATILTSVGSYSTYCSCKLPLLKVTSGTVKEIFSDLARQRVKAVANSDQV